VDGARADHEAPADAIFVVVARFVWGFVPMCGGGRMKALRRTGIPLLGRGRIARTTARTVSGLIVIATEAGQSRRRRCCCGRRRPVIVILGGVLPGPHEPVNLLPPAIQAIQAIIHRITLDIKVRIGKLLIGPLTLRHSPPHPLATFPRRGLIALSRITRGRLRAARSRGDNVVSRCEGLLGVGAREEGGVERAGEDGGDFALLFGVETGPEVGEELLRVFGWVEAPAVGGVGSVAVVGAGAGARSGTRAGSGSGGRRVGAAGRGHCEGGFFFAFFFDVVLNYSKKKKREEKTKA